MHTSYLPTGQRSRLKEVIQMQISSDINPRRRRDNQFFLEGKYDRPRSSREPRKSKKRQGWEALSHNAPHILRELQLHFKVSTSRLIFISLSICSALWNNYAILKNRGLNTPSNSMHSKIRHLLRYRPRPILEHLSNNVCEKHAH